jgi:hypothetical protein
MGIPSASAKGVRITPIGRNWIIDTSQTGEYRSTNCPPSTACDPTAWTGSPHNIALAAFYTYGGIVRSLHD